MSFFLLHFLGGSTNTTVVINVRQSIEWYSLLSVSWTGTGENI